MNGTIVLCDSLVDGSTQVEAGAIGTVMQGDIDNDFGFSFPLSASYLNSSDGGEVFDYMNSTRSSKIDCFYTYVSFSIRFRFMILIFVP